jgi:CBS domain-containing protein
MKGNRTMVKLKELLRSKGGEVWYVVPKTSVCVVIQLMAEKGVGALPVVDETGLVGIISERDMMRIIAVNKNCLDEEISEYMTRNVITASPETTLEECMQLMIDKHFRHLPVVEDGQLTGIVSIRDVVRVLLDQRDALITDLENYIVGKR